MSSACLLSTLPGSDSAVRPTRDSSQTLRRFCFPVLVWPIVLVAVLLVQRSAAQINVDTTAQGVTSGQCSLQEAIYATEFGDHIAVDQTDPDDTYYTGCSDPTGNWNTIVLQNTTYSFTTFWDGDAHNPFGPTATPIIFSTITIEGNGATLQWTGTGYSRLFAVGEASISPTSGVLNSGTYSGTGNLTLQNVYVKNFRVKGGDGAEGGGGGLGAGGAIYVGKVSSGTPILTVQNSTFEANQAVGGNGALFTYSSDGTLGYFSISGGGGGLAGNGAKGEPGFFGGGPGGGGGGGARGNGGTGGFGGAGGGGTVFSGGNGSSTGPGGAGGLYCGGNGGDGSNLGNDGHDGKCPGGGGGGGGEALNAINLISAVTGGNGAYGGGGGGGPDNGGNGGFGGGGGAGSSGGSCGFGCANIYGGGSGGNGGFGGGGGTAFSNVTGGPGSGGKFGGNAIGAGGGGGALGGVIFNDSGTVTVQNSTFFNNSVTRGLGGSDVYDGFVGYNGADAGGAIFSRNGALAVLNATISNNQTTGDEGGIVVMNDGSTPSFTLDNSILANNGLNGTDTAKECNVIGSASLSGVGNLILSNNGCPGVVVTSDPQLQPLALNKPGNTPTMALPAGSSAIAAADVNSSLATDQRGVQRKPTPDIGAYESVPLADLSLSKVVSASTAKAGDMITYSLTVGNNGPDTADTVTVNDDFPSALTFVSCFASGIGSCGIQGGAVVGTYSTMPSGDSETVIIKGILNSGFARGTVITNTASVQASSPQDSDTANNAASASFAVIVPDFSITAASPITIPVSGSGTSSVLLTSIDGFTSAVNLTASGPGGFKESFSAISITPPSGGSKSSTLTVTLDPSITAGSYNVTITAKSGVLTHTDVVNVIVKSTLAGTANMINADQTLGCIDNSGIATALTSKLTTAQNALSSGQTGVEINTLQALLNQLYAQAGKHIALSCTDGTGQTFNPDAALVTTVKDLLSISGATLADPITGTVTNASGIAVQGVTVKLLNSNKNILATAITDAAGFYYFAATGNLIPGSVYTTRVSVPAGYKGVTPPSQSFTWNAASVGLSNFALN